MSGTYILPITHVAPGFCLIVYRAHDRAIRLYRAPARLGGRWGAVGGRHTRHCNYTLCNNHARTSRAATSEISISPGRPPLKHVQATRGAAVTKIETKPSAGVGLAAGAPNRRRECGPKGAALASCTRVSGPAAAPRSSAGCNLVAVARLALLAQGALLGSSGPRPRDHALLHERRVQFLEFVIIEHVVAVGVKVCHHLV